MSPCLTLSTIRYVSNVKWSNPGKGVAPSLTPRCSSYWKRSLRTTLDYSRQFYLYIYIYLILPETSCLLILSLIQLSFCMTFEWDDFRKVLYFFQLFWSKLEPLSGYRIMKWKRQWRIIKINLENIWGTCGKGIYGIK